MAISHHLFDLQVHGSHHRSTALRPGFGYVSTDIDPYLEGHKSSKSEINVIISVAHFVIIRFRRLLICQMIM